MSDTAAIARPTTVNGLNLDDLGHTVEAINADAGQARVAFHVKTRWTGQTRSESLVESYRIGGVEHPRRFKIVADEPHELLGSNSAPNPQELLMSAVNACMMVGYVANASIRGITLDECVIEMDGELDLRGFLGLDASVPAGYERLDYRVRLSGNGTREQYEEIHQAVMATSPNFFNISRPIALHGTLENG